MLTKNDQAISRILESARRKLLETGTRNRLVHVNRANQRSGSLNVINERSDDLYTLLRIEAKKMRFKGMGRDRVEDEEGLPLLSEPEDILGSLDERYTDLIIETPLGPEALVRRLLRLAKEARTAEEEQGLNILYLALGFLRWKEAPNSDQIREAPLVLLPVELVRNDRSASYSIKAREEDISTNLSLQERLRQDFGITLPEVEADDGWLPSTYFELVREAISGQKDWDIDENGIQLGFFSFAKLLMHRDLDPTAWPEGAFVESELLNRILLAGFEHSEPIFRENDNLDEILDPADIIQVIDADASQTKVIEEVRRGASLVVQGPPGTGKSQTITNIISAAAHDGKTVLFVAEKMAALSVVHDRLLKVGLGDICLELHSRTANKRAVVQELGRTLSASAQAMPDPADPAKLRKTRDELNRIAHALHRPGAGIVEPPFRSISQIIGFIGKGKSPPVIDPAGLESLSRDEQKKAETAISRFVTAFEKVGRPEKHPFFAARNIGLQPTDLARLERELAVAADELAKLQIKVSSLSADLKLPVPETFSEIRKFAEIIKLVETAPENICSHLKLLFPRTGEVRLIEALEAGSSWNEAYKNAEAIFAPSAWNAELSAIRTRIVSGKTSLFARLFGGYRSACRELAGLMKVPLPPSPSERLSLVDTLSNVQVLRKRLADDETWLQGALGAAWRGERTDFSGLFKCAVWISAVRQSGFTAGEDELLLALNHRKATTAKHLIEECEQSQDLAIVPLDKLAFDREWAGVPGDTNDFSITWLITLLTTMRGSINLYADWAEFNRSVHEAKASGAGEIVKIVLQQRMPPEDATAEFAYACAEARWNAARRSRPELDEIAGLDRHELVQIFRQLEKDRLSETRYLILQKHFAQMPRGSVGEMQVIRGEIARKKGHKPVRWLIAKAGTMIQRIKPVMLMSPISVAQFLPPDSLSFDLVLIDEASQVRPEDAIGVLARARQIVVVGDQKQLPPTSFFDRILNDGDDSDDEEAEALPPGATAAEMESILSLCEARGLRQRMLEWHYRSRDPSLIRVSNAEFYEDRLVLPPSPLQVDPNFGLRFKRIPGVYASKNSGLGRPGTNRIEAEEIAKGIARHARENADLSLGVATFSKAQADMITEVLEIERRHDPELDHFLREGKAEDVFIKNIENVQGDERDVIMISVGYGPNEPNGRLASQSFGPVNNEGGERRLNVLFSRARVRCDVYCSFDPGDIDPRQSKRDGPRVLKRYLEFAKSGIIEEKTITGEGADSPFEEDVLQVVRNLGFEADAQVGSAGFRVDIGVRHKDRSGQYILAIECDGAAYHSALWARERDRLRQDILESLGWRFHRIWSTDWFHRRSREIDRLRAALEQACVESEAGIAIRGSNFAKATSGNREKHDPVEIPETLVVDHLELTAPAYEKSNLTVKSHLEPHDAPMSQLADLVHRIVSIEGPIHLDELARRVAAAFGKQRTGNRISEATRQAAFFAKKQGLGIEFAESFVATDMQLKETPIRDRSRETGSLVKAEYLPPMEVAAAASLIRKESGEIEIDDLVRAVARLLGFQRVGPELSDTIRSIIERSC